MTNLAEFLAEKVDQGYAWKQVGPARYRVVDCYGFRPTLTVQVEGDTFTTTEAVR